MPSKTPKLLLTGANGQVGLEIVRLAKNEIFSVVALSHSDLDITSKEVVTEVFRRYEPTLVVNAAAYTAVDQAETERKQAFAVNCDGACHVARLCSELDIPMIHFSTDYVFDGNKMLPYEETDTAVPLGVYGQSKLAGEDCIRQYCPQHIILRVSWVFGAHGKNFVKTILNLARTQESLRIINDQRGCPTPAQAIAQTTLILVDRFFQSGELSWGTYHYAGKPPTTWYEFAKVILDEAGGRTQLKVREMIPISTQDYPTPAKRPMNSVLRCVRIQEDLGIVLPMWREGVHRVVEELLL